MATGVWERPNLEDYAWQKFFDALRSAVTSTAPLQARLATLARGVRELRREHFPDDDTWGRYAALLNATKGPKGHGSVEAATAKMSDEEAGRWLEEAIRIFSNLAEESEV